VIEKAFIRIMPRLPAYAALLILSGCAGEGTLRHPAQAGPSQPAASLDVQGTSGLMRLAVGGESRQVELRGDDSLVLTGTARDSRGIKDIALQGNAVVTCADPATGATSSRSTGFLRRHVPGSVLRGKAPSERDSRFVLRVGDLARLCPGQRLESAVGQARLQASNYRGDAAATPHLEFRVAVGEAAANAIPVPGAKAIGSGSGTATGFAPEAGIGGSGAASRPTPPSSAAPIAPRICPRSAAPGRAAERRESGATGDACLDPPVPSLSPPIKPSPPTSRLTSPRDGAPQGIPPACAQRSQIRRS
jgi:hypothetical protein